MSFDEIATLIDPTNSAGLLPNGLDWGSYTFWGIIDTIQALITNGLLSIFDLCYQGIEKFSDVTQNIGNADVMFNGIADIATLILIIIFLKQIFTNYILDLDGEADADPIQALVNISVALAVINCGSEIHNVFMKISNLSIEYLRTLITASEINPDISFGEGLWNTFIKAVGETILLLVPATGPWLILLIVIFMIVVCVLMVVLAGKVLLRGVELFIFQCLMPIFACDLVTPNKELWKPFFRAYLITIFGWLIQYFCMMISISIIYQFNQPSEGIEGLMTPLLSVGLLFFACKAPKWLQSFTYQTGAGQAASSGARGVMGTATQIISTARAIK